MTRKIREEKRVRRILIVLGGGRRDGNTAQLTDAFTKGAVEVGHQVETISLAEIEVKGCLGATLADTKNPVFKRMHLTALFQRSKKRT